MICPILVTTVLASCIAGCGAQGLDDTSTSHHPSDELANSADVPGEGEVVGESEQALSLPKRASYRNAGSGDCIGVDRARTDATAPLMQFPCDGTENQIWLNSSNKKTLENSKKGKCFSPLNGSTASFVNLALERCGGPNQAWKLREHRLGGFQIVSIATGKCVGIEGGSAKAGALVIQGPCNDRINQRWTQVPH